MIRKPVVAGQFYPGDPETLRRYLHDVVASEFAPKRVFGLIAPHAGYVYSGRVAGAVFARVEVPETVLLLGPNHTGMGTRASIVSQGSWATPLGTVEVDTEFAVALLNECPLLEEDSLAHTHEHSLEVQLPFIQTRNHRAKIVPIAFMLRTIGEVEEVGEAVAQVLATWPSPVLVVTSSDMNHYESQKVTKHKDALAIERILQLDEHGLLEIARHEQISMCGVIPAAVMIAAAKRYGASGGELILHTTSGETSGDFDRVVGYAGIVIV